MASAFYPLTMPLTVGPGSIAVMLTIGSNAPSAVTQLSSALVQAAGGLAGVAAVGVSIYLSYRYADRILRRLGESGINAMLRLSAFILLCLGVQIILNGYRAVAAGLGVVRSALEQTPPEVERPFDLGFDSGIG